MSAQLLSKDDQAYYEAFREELKKQLKRTFKMKRNLYEFAKECKIFMPYGLDKAASIMYIAEHLAKHEMKQRHGVTQFDKEMQEMFAKMKPEDKVGRQYNGIGSASVVVEEDSKTGKATKTVPLSIVTNDTKENATELKTITESKKEPLAIL